MEKTNSSDFLLKQSKNDYTESSLKVSIEKNKN